MTRIVALAAALALSACGNPTQQAAVNDAFVTLASVAAANNTTVASLVAKGALFCQSPQLAASQTIAGMVAVSLVSGKAASVLNQTSKAVSEVCAGLSMVPVAPPADPSVVPAVVVPSATLPPTA